MVREMQRKTVLKAITFIVILIMLFSVLNSFSKKKGDDYKVASFYDEPKHSLDVVFCGSSTMLSVYPMELWNDYGIASFNFSQHGQSWALTYWAVKEAIEYQSPKLVVVDTHFFNCPSRSYLKGYAHNTIDNMRFSLNKILCIQDVIPREEQFEFYVPITVFHSRWKDLFASVKRLTEATVTSSTIDFYKGSYFRGGQTDLPTILKQDEIIPVNETMEWPELGVEYLNKIIELCEKTDTKLLLIAMPYYPSEPDFTVEYQKMENLVYSNEDTDNIKYLKLLFYVEQIGLDFKTDMSDAAHANYFGGRKITDFLGAYINSNYDLPDHRGEKEYQNWDELYLQYIEAQNNFEAAFYDSLSQ